MKKVFEILKQIESTSSRTEKEKILSDNRDNELLKKTLEYALNPYKIFRIGKKSLEGDYGHSEHPSDIFTLLDTLLANGTSTDADKSMVVSFLKAQSEEDAEWYRRIILKDIKIGANVKTINKIWKGLIESFNVMLAEKYADHEDYVEGKEFIVTTKLDGNRVVAIKEGDSITMFTRQGQVYDGLVDIEEELKQLPNGVYDGELIAENPKGLNSADLYRATTSIVRKDGIKKGVIFHIFDMVDIPSFKNGVCEIPCWIRKGTINKIFLDNPQLKWLAEVPILYRGRDTDMIVGLLDVATSRGEEGIMLNISNEFYYTKRAKAILKCKKFNDCDVRVLSIEKGEGKYEHTLGKINVEYKGNIVGVGSGFSDEMRDKIFNNPNNYIGRIVKIKYFEETKNSKNNKISLRFPVFVEWREDGKEVSYY